LEVEDILIVVEVVIVEVEVGEGMMVLLICSHNKFTNIERHNFNLNFNNVYSKWM
jgi:hypothetical protein